MRQGGSQGDGLSRLSCQGQEHEKVYNAANAEETVASLDDLFFGFNLGNH